MNFDYALEKTIDAPDESRLSRFVLLALLLTIAFWNIDHIFDASENMKFAASYDGHENVTSDSMQQLNPLSTITRLLLAALGFYFIVKPKQTPFQLSDGLLYLMLGMFLYSWMTLLWSAAPAHTLKKLVVVTTVVVAASGFARQFSLRDLGKMFALTGGLLCGIGLLVEIWLGNFRPWANDYRFTGTVHPNTLAIYGTIMCFAAGLFLPAKKQFGLLTCILLFGGIGVLLLTKSRTSLGRHGDRINRDLLVAIPGRESNSTCSARICYYCGRRLSVFDRGRQGGRIIGSAAAMGRTADVTTLTGRLPLWEELLRNI